MTRVADVSPPPASRHRFDACDSQWRPAERGPVLHCLMLPGHEGTHQAYYGDRLHEWPTPDGDVLAG
jgi:hypothetical protein